jgi:hypothetical protein
MLKQRQRGCLVFVVDCIEQRVVVHNVVHVSAWIHLVLHQRGAHGCVSVPRGKQDWPSTIGACLGVQQRADRGDRADARSAIEGTVVVVVFFTIMIHICLRVEELRAAKRLPCLCCEDELSNVSSSSELSSSALLLLLLPSLLLLLLLLLVAAAILAVLQRKKKSAKRQRETERASEQARHET